MTSAASDRFYGVRLLGGLSVASTEAGESHAVSVPSGNGHEFLAFLLLHPRARHRRERVGELLWPGDAPEKARRALSDLLYRLRQALGDDWFLADADSVGLHPELRLAVDVWAFEEAIKRGDINSLEKAVDRYRGELVPEIDADWILLPRVALHESYLDALQLLATDAEERQARGRALIYYRQLVQADPLREQGHRGVMRMLARSGHAAEALAIYDELAKRLRQELDVPPSVATQQLAQHLRGEQEARLAETAPEPVVVGRKRERAVILRRVDALAEKRGGMVGVEGEAGMGKSALLHSIAASARWRRVRVSMVQAPQQPADSPFAILRSLLAEALAPPHGVQIDAALSLQQRAALAPIYPEWQRHAGVLVELPAERARDRLHAAARALFLALSELGPQLLILDDAHWAGPSVWALLDAVAPLLASSRLLLVLAYRRHPAQRGPGWRYVRRWEEEGMLQITALSPLAIAEVAQMLPASLRDQAERVHAATGGNPFYINEVLLNADDEVSAPQRAVAQRARQLPLRTWMALEAAAVIGDVVPYGLWRAVTDRDHDELTRIGQQLVRRVLLRPVPAGHAFVHSLIRDAVYAEVPAQRAAQLHRQVADLLADEPDAPLRLRAHHLERAGAANEAAALYARGGRQALEEFAHAESQFLLQRALALIPADDGPGRVDVLLDLAAACEVTGDREQQKAALDEALALAEADGSDALLLRVLIGMGQWAARTGAHDEARIHLDRALALAQCGDARARVLEIELILGDLIWRSGAPRVARTHLERALDLARALEDPVAEARALDGIAWNISQVEGDQEKVFGLYAEALAVQRAAGDRLGEARTLLNMLSSYQNIGAWDRLYRHAAEAVAAQRRVSYTLGEAIAHQSLGLAAYSLGDSESAHREVEAARAGFDLVGERLGVVITTDTLGLIAQRQGDHEEAEARFCQALTLASALDASVFNAFVQQDYGLFLLAQQRHEQSVELLQQAIVNWRSSGERLNPLKCEAALGLALLALDRCEEAAPLAEAGWQAFQQEGIGGEEIQQWYWLLARLQRELGWQARADALLDAAHADLLQQARALSDPAMRRRFFSDVSLNAAIVAARDERTGTVRRQTLSLARAGAPSGRALSAEEMTTVSWTLYAPEDDLIDDATERRRLALVRLLEEAAARDAVATDRDLADALGVSRRTVLRDRKVLVDRGVDFPKHARA